jgi:hypothetical protein
MNISAYFQKLSRRPRLSAMGLIVLVSLVSYGIWIPFLGFYGDDWSYIWLLFKGVGIASFFNNNRPILGPIYQALAALLGPSPQPWHLFMFLCHTLCACIFWLILDKIWPNHRRYTLLAAFLHLNYPGFFLNQVAVTACMYYVVLGSFYLSIYLNLRWLDHPSRRGWLLAAGLVCSLLNLTLDEYFFFMELARPILLYFYLDTRDHPPATRIKTVLAAWWPYLVLYLMAIVWRMMFQSQITHHPMSLLDDARRAFFPTLFIQFRQMAHDIWVSGPRAWLTAFHPNRILGMVNIPYHYYLIAILLLAANLYLIVWLVFPRQTRKPESLRTALTWVIFGLLWCLLSGWPIWLSRKPIGDYYIVSRFTIPFLPGEVMMLVGLLMIIQRYPKIQLGLAALLVASTIGLQWLVGFSYQQDWAHQKAFYYQLYWRFKGIQPGTTLIVSRPPTDQGEENSMSAELNWFFSPRNPSPEVDYYSYFIPQKFFSDNPNFLAGQKVDKGHLIGGFTASSDRLVSVEWDEHHCIRVMDAESDGVKFRPRDLSASMARLSQPAQVTIPERGDTADRLNSTFGREPAHNWCWLYQQADFLKQKGDWAGLVSLARNMDPASFRHDWRLLIPFVEAYAHTNQPDKAARLINGIHKIHRHEIAPFCQITSRWMTDLNPQGDFLTAIQSTRSRSHCQ